MIARNRSGPGEAFLPRSPPGWLLFLLAASPLLRFGWGEATVYPGHWAISVLLAVLLAGGVGAARGQRLPFRAGALLGGYLTLVAAAREDWALTAVSGGAFALNFCWGWGAYRMAHGRRGAGSAPDGIVLWLGAALLAGLLGWAATFVLPQLCAVLNCREEWSWPAPFFGGWNSHGQWLALLVLVLPVVGPLLLMASRARRGGPGRWVLYGIAAGCALGALAGARWWAALLAVAAVVLGLRALGKERRAGDGRLLRGIALVAAAEMVLLYGLAPGYLSLAVGTAGAAREVRVEQLSAAAEGLSSARETLLQLRVTNRGLTTLFSRPGREGTLRARLLITRQGGDTRAHDGEPVALATALPPRGALTVFVPVRLPHWVQGGFLTWRAEDWRGRPFALSGDSHFGFRFSNPAYRPLTDGRENTLSALAARAREFERTTVAPPESRRNRETALNILGAMGDTLLSPLWGLKKSAAAGQPGAAAGVFAGPRPFWIQLWQGYGALGLALAAWFGLRLARQAARVARNSLPGPERLGWNLVPTSVALLALTGFFSPVLGSFHALWGLALLSGYVEGRHDRMFPPRPRFKPPKPRKPSRRPRRMKTYAPPRPR